MLRTFLLIMLLVTLGTQVRLQELTAKEDAVRAAPPEFSVEEQSAFFDDARAELVGRGSANTTSNQQGELPSSSANATDSTISEVRWEAMVDSATLEAEVKRIHNNLEKSIGSPAGFRAGRHLQARREFAVLSVLFSVIEEYPQQVRWHEDAGTVKYYFQRAYEACLEASEESFAIAQQTRFLLNDLVFGQALSSTLLDDGSVESKGKSDLAAVELSAIMQRLELALQQHIAPNLESPASFRREHNVLVQEAQLLLMFGEILQREGYDFAYDEEYRSLAQGMQQSAERLGEASKAGDFNAAAAAAQAVSQSCARCHEDYRG